jgi:hypothetical protein
MAEPSDPQAKIDRADKHIRALARMVGAFRKKAYSVSVQPAMWVEPPTMQNALQVVISAEATEDPPSLEWAPIIGDIVHGLRSALDQVAWGLSVDHQATLGNSPPPDPIPRRDPWRSVSFPICLSRSDWPSQWRNKLWAADPALMAVFERLQPFYAGKNTPDREPLAVLDELWNIDKHRHLHLVNATIVLRDVLSVKPFPGLPDLDFEVISKRAPGPLVGPTEIGRARPIDRPGVQTPRTNLPQMFMNPDLAVDVAFDQGAPAYGGSVLKTLRSLRKTTQNIVSAV